MAITFTFDNLEDGQEILVPYEVSGTATADAGTVIHMAGQIDDHEISDIDVPNPAIAAPVFDFNISLADCPTPDTWYILTIYAWDSTGAVFTACRTFKRIEETPPPPVVGSDDETTGG